MNEKTLWHWYLDTYDDWTYAICEVWMDCLLYINMTKKNWYIKGKDEGWKIIFQWDWNEEEVPLDTLMKFMEEKAEHFYDYKYIKLKIKENNQ
jgi:hypothetical protein